MFHPFLIYIFHSLNSMNHPRLSSVHSQERSFYISSFRSHLLLQSRRWSFTHWCFKISVTHTPAFTLSLKEVKVIFFSSTEQIENFFFSSKEIDALKSAPGEVCKSFILSNWNTVSGDFSNLYARCTLTPWGDIFSDSSMLTFETCVKVLYPRKKKSQIVYFMSLCGWRLDSWGTEQAWSPNIQKNEVQTSVNFMFVCLFVFSEFFIIIIKHNLSYIHLKSSEDVIFQDTKNKEWYQYCLYG